MEKIMREVEEILERLTSAMELAKLLSLDDKVELINMARVMISSHSPFNKEPIDCVLWAKFSDVSANDYNPNSVAPPEMELLALSVAQDGYTQPIVAWEKDGGYEVVDGFHRHRVGREVKEITERIHGYLPLAVIGADRTDRGDRIASTIRHNRARGKHAVDSMSDIVVELKKRNWSPKKIGKELGMDPDEVLRLTQISGLAEMFAGRDFSEAWEADLLDDKEYDGGVEELD